MLKSSPKRSILSPYREEPPPKSVPISFDLWMRIIDMPQINSTPFAVRVANRLAPIIAA